MNAFESQLVRLVRAMSDDGILDLVRNQLHGIGGPSASRPRAVSRKPRAAAARAPAARAKRGSRGARIAKGSAEHDALLARVEKAINGSKGMSVSQVVKATALPKLRVASVIRELKQTKRIAQAGERRFARYAKSKQIALKASKTARGR